MTILGALSSPRVQRYLAPLAAIAIIICGMAMTMLSEAHYKDQKIREVRVEADILGASVTAALIFDDEGTAQEYVDALGVNPEVQAVALFDPEGVLIARYRRKGEAPTLPQQIEDPVFKDNSLAIETPIASEGVRLGTVYLRVETEPLERRVLRYGGIMLLVVMGALLVLVLVSSQSAMARANRELALRADALTDANAQLKTHMEEREKAQEVLRQSQKMEALGHLVGGVAHDFNNILTAIINNLELIRNHGTTGKAAEGRIESASAAALRGAGLIRQLMVFSRNEALEPRFLDAGAAIGDVLRMVEGSLPGNVVLDRAPSAEPAVVLADPAQLQTALLNVIFNARDAMPEGGTIRIETGTATRRGEGGDASFAVITVADTGSGIAPGDLPHIFEPFFTTKDVGKGTGLGLSQVFGFVKGAGGDIEVESEEGKGTTIRLLFPLHPASALPEKVMEPQPMPEEKDESHGGTVLFVEDDPFVAYASVDLLEESGFTVLSASRAKEALELLPQHDEVDLLITDIGLPEMNGHDLVAEARRAQPDLRVLFITGYDATSVAERTKLDTRTTILKKPYDPGALVQKVHAILEA